MIELREHQKRCSEQGLNILKDKGLVYLAMETRTGKTITAMDIAQRFGAKEVLFVTKKAVISGAQRDGRLFPLNITYINHESLAKAFSKKEFEITFDSMYYDEASDSLKSKSTKLKQTPPERYDLVIVDEAHAYKAFPKPSLRTKEAHALLKNHPIIFLSATPTPESFSELFHQLWLSRCTPFQEKNFYLWAKKYVMVREHPYLKITMKNGMKVAPKDYSDVIEERVLPIFNTLKVTCTQKEAGFKSEVEEYIIPCKMSNETAEVYRTLNKDKVYTFWDSEEIVCDSATKLKCKLHQISSGSVILYGKERRIIDDTKARKIKSHAEENGYRKFAIYYQFQAELDIIKSVFPNLIFVAKEFEDAAEGIFVSQIISGREGIRLSSGDALYFFNIDYSYLSYEQTRNRMQDFTRETPSKIYWLQSQFGIERKIYEVVKNKENFTQKHFEVMK